METLPTARDRRRSLLSPTRLEGMETFVALALNRLVYVSPTRLEGMETVYFQCCPTSLQ